LVLFFKKELLPSRFAKVALILIEAEDAAFSVMVVLEAPAASQRVLERNGFVRVGCRSGNLR
jgi:hypothetical protein